MSSDSAKKGLKTKLELYGPNYWEEISKKGGKKSPNRPFKDPEKARAAVNARWAKFRAEKAKKEA